jgi:hypothetical protein
MPKSDYDAALAHKYRLADGTTVPSVTTISGLLDIDGKSSAFAGAAVKLTKAGEDYRAIWRAKAQRGTRIHEHCEAFLRGEPIEQLEGDKGFVDALEKWMVTEKPKVIESEFIVLSEKGYGGRGDLICEIHGVMGLWDLKSGRKSPIEHRLQLSMYRYADGVARYDAAGALQSIDSAPLRRVRETGCIHVNEDGTYEMVPYDTDHDTFLAATSLLWVYNWAKGLTK